MTSENQPRGSVLLIGASRGIGHAMAGEFLKRGWSVVGTVRSSGRTMLHGLAEAHPGQVRIETLDICEQTQIASLRERLAGRRFDVLFVNAGVVDDDPGRTIAEVATDEFARGWRPTLSPH